MRPSGKIWIKSVTGVLRIRNWLLRCVGTTVDIVVKIREREFVGCAIIMRSSSVVAGWAKGLITKTRPCNIQIFFWVVKIKKITGKILIF